jgi:hypothetical protein
MAPPSSFLFEASWENCQMLTRLRLGASCEWRPFEWSRVVTNNQARFVPNDRGKFGLWNWCGAQKQKPVPGGTGRMKINFIKNVLYQKHSGLPILDLGVKRAYFLNGVWRCCIPR